MSSREKIIEKNATEKPKSKCPDWNVQSLAMTSPLCYMWTIFNFVKSLLPNFQGCWCNIQSQHVEAIYICKTLLSFNLFVLSEQQLKIKRSKSDKIILTQVLLPVLAFLELSTASRGLHNHHHFSISCTQILNLYEVMTSEKTLFTDNHVL